MMRENVRRLPSGWLALAILVPWQLLCLAGVLGGAAAREPGRIAAALLGFALGAVLLAGLLAVIFGDYRGSAKEPGLRWANPFYARRRVSLLQ